MKARWVLPVLIVLVIWATISHLIEFKQLGTTLKPSQWAWVPMLLGFFTVQRQRLVGPGWRALTETWGVRLAAVLVTLMGVVNVLSAVTPSLAERLRILE
ncbi:MAG TPA: hypothetical protein VIU38_13960, partial [Anaerolineales bacterium]